MKSKCSMKIKRPLPPVPPTATKTVRNDHIYGYGRHTYEYHESAPALDLQIPPTRSNSQAAQSEREMKVILDLAREGKTASQIVEETGYNRNRVIQVVKRFAEYGAKLAPEKPKKRKVTVTKTYRKSKRLVWDDDATRLLIALHANPSLSYTDIGARIGVSKNSVTSKVKRLIDDGVLEPRMEQAPWTDEDTERLFRLRADGKTWNEIGDALGRNGQACMMAHRREIERREKCQKE